MRREVTQWGTAGCASSLPECNIDLDSGPDDPDEFVDFAQIKAQAETGGDTLPPRPRVPGRWVGDMVLQGEMLTGDGHRDLVIPYYQNGRQVVACFDQCHAHRLDMFEAPCVPGYPVED